MSSEDAAQEIGELSAAHLRVYTQQVDEGTVAFVIEDGELEVTINSEFGRPELAALGFERLGTAAMAHADVLRRQAVAGNSGTW